MKYLRKRIGPSKEIDALADTLKINRNHYQSRGSKHRQNKIPKERKKKLKNGAHCLFCGTTQNLTIHHVIPLSQGGDNSDDNLVVLCDSCHQKLHILLDPLLYFLNSSP
ncbi:MAG: 5-methylcytosine-specific restriction enzyme [Patescibacteria group bacterium]|nr:5-methylcytosine-specific restriction enzyme [Patescibacteria group bacterium]